MPSPANGDPTTPTGRNGRDLDTLIASVRQEFNFPIRPRLGIVSPSSRESSINDKCVSIIGYLFWQDRIALQKVIDEFRSDLCAGSVHGNRFDTFIDRLSDTKYLVQNQPSTRKLFQSELASRKPVEPKNHALPSTFADMKKLSAQI
ncbi:hypothetical protein MBLNU459_g6013t1 [Dothideomycetes sp. NU459]